MYLCIYMYLYILSVILLVSVFNIICSSFPFFYGRGQIRHPVSALSGRIHPESTALKIWPAKATPH